jgi:energy-converting hydrogenase Eha subunit E
MRNSLIFVSYNKKLASFTFNSIITAI